MIPPFALSRVPGPAVIFAICLVIRLVVAWGIDSAIPVHKSVDMYATLATNILHGHGFVMEPGGEPIVWRAPLYPFFLAGLFALFGESNTTALLWAQSIMDATTATFAWWIGGTLFSPTCGLLAALGFALHPLSAYYTLRFLSEPLFTLCLTATSAGLVWACRQSNLLPWGVVGLTIACMALVRPAALLFCPFLLLGLRWCWHDTEGQWLRVVAIVTAGSLVPLAPWALRNAFVSHSFIPVATGGGYALWIGNHRLTDGREDWEVGPTTLQVLEVERRAIRASVEPVAPPGEADSDAYTNISPTLDQAFARAALAEISSDPIGWGRLLLRKFARFWFSVFLPKNTWAQWYVFAAQAMLLSLALMGIVAGRTHGTKLVILLLPVLYLAFLHTLTFATLRYSIPLLPTLFVLAAAGALALRQAVARWDTAMPHGSLVLKIKALKTLF
ncbi:MAG: glycosyltransferase family 39 protein [Nitrospiraceae bacterium]